MSTTTSTPRVNKDCPNVDNFLYDGSNCDPGYWCGCSDPNGTNCAPSNDLTATNWAGHFTLVEDGTEKVLTGWASIYSDAYFQCADSLYCPGYTGTDSDTDSGAAFCPTLCQAGHYCPDSTQQLPCPDGHYCLIGSTEPTECTGLEKCNGPGNDIYTANTSFGIVLATAVVLFGALLTGSYKLKHPKVMASNASNVSVKTTDSEGPLEKRESVVMTQGPTQKISVAFQDLQLTLPNGKCIMQGVSGKLDAGSFCAILGPSGAGKSTFLSLLSGKVDRTGGRLTINGEEHQSLAQFRNLVGFVPQEDTMLRELTVYENIRHAAMMRLPASWTTAQKLERVEDVILSLDLDQVRHSIIGDALRRGISGGQRKRVNVAMELVSDPALLCLDEPTSGLDSTSSTTLCETLRALARTGVNVSAVLHQPKTEIFEMFDNVLLLGVGGRTVYLGPATEMTTYFTRIGFPLPPRVNPSDYYMDVVAGLIPCDHLPNFVKEDLFQIWCTAAENPDRDTDSPTESLNDTEGSIASTKTKSTSRMAVYKHYWSSLFAHVFASGTTDARQTPGLLGQAVLLFRRALLQRIREPANTFFPLILSMFVGAIAGASAKATGLNPSSDNKQPIYYGVPNARTDPAFASYKFLENYPIPSTDNVVSLWQTTALNMMLVCVLGINVFGRERAVFFRDTASGTKVTAYWAAKTLEVFLWLPVYAAVFSATAYMIQPLAISLVDFWLVCWMTFIGFYGIGACLSILISPENRGIATLVFGLILILGFTGLLFPFEGKGYFMIFYTFWTGQAYSARTYDVYEENFDTGFLNQQYAGYDLSISYGLNVGMAFVSSFAWHILALILLKVHDFRKQR